VIIRNEKATSHPRTMAQHSRAHSEAPVPASSEPVNGINNSNPARPATQHRPNNNSSYNEPQPDPSQTTIKQRVGAPRSVSASRHPLQNTNPAASAAPVGASGRVPIDASLLKMEVPNTLGMNPPRTLKHQASDSTEYSLRSRGHQIGGHSNGRQHGVQVRRCSLTSAVANKHEAVASRFYRPQ
jgi:hypothetical protein